MPSNILAQKVPTYFSSKLFLTIWRSLMKMRLLQIFILVGFLSNTAMADGQAVYAKTCAACHATGVAGAPKLGDKNAWAPRIGTGVDALVASVTNGKGLMPPKGACMDCSNEDFKASVDYMISQSK